MNPKRYFVDHPDQDWQDIWFLEVTNEKTVCVYKSGERESSQSTWMGLNRVLEWCRVGFTVEVKKEELPFYQ